MPIGNRCRSSCQSSPPTVSTPGGAVSIRRWRHPMTSLRGRPPPPSKRQRMWRRRARLSSWPSRCRAPPEAFDHETIDEDSCSRRQAHGRTTVAKLLTNEPDVITAEERPLTENELESMNAFWRACNYLSVGMIYLRENPLLREPLKTEHVKHRLLGHWGASPALSFVWVHLNRTIVKQDLNVIFVAGPGHGAPGVLGPAYLEGTYSEIYPDKSEDL